MIEIVNFYIINREDSKQFMQGTLHVYLVDLEIDLRGVFVSKKKDFWHFSLPLQKALDSEKKTNRYPVISFRDRDKTTQLLQAIREKGKPYIEEYLKTNTQPIEANDITTLGQITDHQENTQECPVIEKKPTPQKHGSNFKIPTNTWVSLPVRKPTLKKQTTTKR